MLIKNPLEISLSSCIISRELGHMQIKVKLKQQWQANYLRRSYSENKAKQQQQQQKCTKEKSLNYIIKKKIQKILTKIDESCNLQLSNGKCAEANETMKWKKRKENERKKAAARLEGSCQQTAFAAIAKKVKVIKVHSERDGNGTAINCK